MPDRIDDDALLRDLYAGVVDPGRFDRFLDGLAAASGSHIATMTLQDLACPERSRAYSVGATGDDLSRYAGHAADNIWVQRSLPHLQAGAVLDGDDFVPAAELLRSRYYGEFLEGLDIRHSVAMCGEANMDGVAMVTLCRSARGGAYDDGTLARLRRIGPHWANAYGLLRALDAARTEGMADAPLATAVAMLDRGFHWLRGNAAADRMRSLDWWAPGADGRLEATSAAGRAAWREARRVAATGPAASGAHLFAVHGRDGGRVAFAALHPVPARGAGDVAHLLVVRPLQPAQRAGFEARLRAVFGLTAAEAALAAALQREGDLAAAAAVLGIAAPGARTRLQSVFSKTDCHRQGELLRLLDAVAELAG